MDGVERTLPGAQCTADTSRGADRLHILAFRVVGALHPVLGVIGHELNQVIGTCGHALAAGHALLLVHHGHAVLHMDCVKGTGLHAGSQAHTAHAAGFGAGSGHHRSHPAVLDSAVCILYFGILTVSFAAHKGNLLLTGLRRYAHDGRNFLAHRSAAHRAGIGRSLSRRNRLCQRVTARKSAAAAVVSRQLVPDGLLLLIYFHLELLAEKSKADTYNNTRGRYDNSRYNNRRNIHFRLLLLQ